jgi:hypothetical protein
MRQEEVTMAYLYLDDGYPESEDYANNYIYFNASDPECLQKMIQLARTLESVSPPERKAIIEKFITRENSSVAL